MKRTPRAIVAVASAVTTIGGFTAIALAPPAAAVVPGKVSGGIMTTDEFGVHVNQNQYTAKSEVYLSGGPNNAHAHFLELGDYFLAILEPSGQSDPNDGGQGNLSDDVDAAVDRTFHADGLGNVSALVPTTHFISSANVIQAGLPPEYFADTSNPGGVYIAAVCQYVPVSDTDATPQHVRPQDCKYDAFKVNEENPPVTENSAPTASKTATPTHVRKVHWSITKTVDGVHSETFTQSSPRTLNYSVAVTKTVDYDTYGVTGTITVFNSNDDPMTVDVSEDGIADPSQVALDGSSCSLDGSGSLIVPGRDSVTLDPGSNSVDYSCTFTSAPDETVFYTNTATVTYDIGNGDEDLPVASDPFQFPAATLSSDSAPETIHVTDAFNGGLAAALSPATVSDSYTWNYQRVVSNSNCHTYDNTATITETTQSDSDHVTFCGPISGGLTMGWWQNKNGQKLLAANVANACSAFNGHLPAVFVHGSTKYLPDAYTAYSSKFKQYDSAKCTTTGDSSYLPTFDINVFTAANASQTGTQMVEGQFLTTALNTAAGYVNQGAGVPGGPSLGSTGVVIPLQLQGAANLGLGSCATVSDLLTAAAARYPNYASSKTSVTQALIPLLTNINQSQALTCTP